MALGVIPGYLRRIHQSRVYPLPPTILVFLMVGCGAPESTAVPARLPDIPTVVSMTPQSVPTTSATAVPTPEGDTDPTSEPREDSVIEPMPSAEAPLTPSAPDPKIEAGQADINRWWTVFEDPVLNQLVEKGYRQNLTLQVAGLRILRNRANLGIAIGDQYPQVQEATGGYSLNTVSENAANSAGAKRDYGSASVGFDASWEIDLWDSARPGPIMSGTCT